MGLYRAFATVGGLTMVSRVLGFVRDILIAGVLGTGVVADAFFAAFRLPNLFRRLFGEGAFNSAFVPLFAKKLETDGHDHARRFAEEAMAGLVLVLLVLTAVAQIAMPWLVLAITPGFAASPEKFDLAVLLTRITFPYLLCMSLVALLSGLLNALRRFWAAAAAPILLNIVLIAAIGLAHLFGLGNSSDAGLALAWGVAVAGVLQLVMLLAAARNAGVTLALRRPRLTPDVRRLVSLGIPGLVAGGITQINIVVGTMIASLEAGAIAYLYYADRIYQLPLGVVGIAIGVVLLPDVSRQLGAGNEVAVQDSQNRSLEFSLLLTLPAAAALFAIPEPIIRVLFERGAFSSTDTEAVSLALAAFAIGLPAFVMIKVFSPAYFAREDTRTPMRYAGVGMLVNVVGSLALFYAFVAAGWYPHVGIAVATSLAGWINAGLLWSTLVARGQFIADARLLRRLPRIILCAFAMAAVVWWLSVWLRPAFGPESGLLVQLMALAALVGSGAVVYGVLCAVTGAGDIGAIMRKLRRRRARPDARA
ncbi:MAG: murein biosynthesis integral membrane protein MurJ [Rhizobiales bacterium]|nr:murein biosynthesis integral membrane protein MurJ [Hyphomicrobiales bacterium]